MNSNSKWACGYLPPGNACDNGPDRRGRCQMAYRCTPFLEDDAWTCNRPGDNGGPCDDGPLPDGACCNPSPACKPVRTVRARVEITAVWTGVTILGLAALAMSYAADSKFLMPGPVSTAHGSLSKCSDCHTNVADGKFRWLLALVKNPSPQKDAAACLNCHKMGKQALSPHAIPSDHLQARARDSKSTAAPAKHRAQARIANLLFPTDSAGGKDVFCATCHKEHRGVKRGHTVMPAGSCQQCHKVQFENFKKDHPTFAMYPFKRRTRLNFDHAAHFGDHFPKTREKKPAAQNIPGSCADCHRTADDGRRMSVKPFLETCSTCHLPQIVGAERATGPKGIALLALPGLDVKTLEERNAGLGEWPALSEAEITPLMKLLLGGGKERRNLFETIDKLDLLDLTKASDQQIAAVVKLAWEVKHLIHLLTTSKASGVMARIGAATGAKLDRKLMAGLIAMMPRDVLLNAQREWLPNLDAEIKKRDGPNWSASVKTTARSTKTIELPSRRKAKVKARGKPRGEPQGRPLPVAEQAPSDKLVANPKLGRWRISVLGDLVQEGGKSSAVTPPAKDDGKKAPTAENKAPAGASASARPKVKARPPKAVDAESWSEFGGWYRKDFAILYKPTGHADGFMKAWLDFSGTLFSDAKTSLAAPVFELLTDKDAQGQCTKCHSIDAPANGSRKVQWRPSSLADKKMRFTKFRHEPHFALLDERGCLTCHEMNAPRKIKKSKKSLDPTKFVSNFKSVKKKLCATCHRPSAARQDCLLCHKYHVAPVTTPMMSTKLPSK